jgi:predicted Zn-dependent protease
MTFKRDTAAGLTALVLALAGCSEEGGTGMSARDEGRKPALVQLLGDADRAMAAGQLADAGRKLDEARGLDPNDPALWVAIARLRFRGGEHLTAIEAADRALELGPDHPPALLMRAVLVRDAHGFAAALPWFEAALTADPYYRDGWAEYAATLGDAGEAGAMLEAVRKLAEVAPGDERVPYLQAVLAARGGEYSLARSLLARSGMAARGVPAALQLDAVISLAEGNADSAAVILEGLVARQPSHAKLRELLAKAMLESGRGDELIARFGPEAGLREASPYLVMLVARAYEQRGDRMSAAPLLARAMRGASTAPVVLAVREGLPVPTATARQAGLIGHWSTARASTQALGKRFSASADVAALSGDVLLGAGDPKAALSVYAVATKVKRPWPLTRKAVLAYVRSGDEASADTLLARHVAGEPDNASALTALAERFGQRGDWMRAARLLDHAIALGAGHDPALLRLRLRAARTLNQPDEARRFAAWLAEVHPRHLVQR